MPAQPKPCQHATIQLEPSACATRVGFEPVSAGEVLAAAVASGENPYSDPNSTQAAAEEFSSFFPAPLILPGDELAYEPDEEGQAFHEWLGMKERNKPTKRRNVLYVAAAPRVTPEAKHIEAWTEIRCAAGQHDATGETPQPPQAEDVIGFLGAFYHGMQVKPFPQRLRFVRWADEIDHNDTAKDISYIGLAAKDNCTRIRARPCPDGIFEAQLNLEDILDAALAMLPADAYAILLLVDHDLYESEEDDFCCGRAYGGSRVCVVQTARYHPALDEHAGIDRAHMWPASHCKAYLDKLCRAEGIKIPTRKAAALTARSRKQPSAPGPLRLAIAAAATATTAQRPKTTTTASDDDVRRQLQGLWFSRLARTAAHELGHCLGLAHCVYAACLMQGTASVAEDVRQPPYLCVVCVSKVGHAVACELEKKRKPEEVAGYLVERYQTLARVCGRWEEAGVGMFAGYSAWVRARIANMQR
ncbi:hypothetical protein Micbo1qcDRAFT_166636 [Microdochium bolleyi]|uniref:Archaemetzincin-2 n=1 Tax=Microdochium bolleyi TaxID=196109 RepID=A0A136IUI5_9PEZI|nr:hypothetical protein Micbo1qcDRAFT_166636 [Microdochium bolleyi]